MTSRRSGWLPRGRPTAALLAAALLVAALLVAACGGGSTRPGSEPSSSTSASLTAGSTTLTTTTATLTPNPPGVGIHKIRHVVIIMQENRSFDSYFGTYPGADGIPMKDGVPTVCVPDPANGTCVRPFHDRHDRNLGRPARRRQLPGRHQRRADGRVRPRAGVRHEGLRGDVQPGVR